jgi:hypothetical protein
LKEPDIVFKPHEARRVERKEVPTIQAGAEGVYDRKKAKNRKIDNRGQNEKPSPTRFLLLYSRFHNSPLKKREALFKGLKDFPFEYET